MGCVFECENNRALGREEVVPENIQTLERKKSKGNEYTSLVVSRVQWLCAVMC
jgi:hypothetical protein